MERSPGAGLARGDPIMERSPGVTQERERRASPEEGIPERERNTGAGPGNPGANPERETSPDAAQERKKGSPLTQKPILKYQPPCQKEGS